MKSIVAVVALAGVAIGSASAAEAQGQRGMGGIVGITVYQDRDFRGRNANFRNDVPDLRASGMNDRIVSFQIAAGETWEVCEHEFYRGRCQVFYGVERDLRQRGWARTISSMRRVGGSGGGWGGGGGGVYPPGRPEPPMGQGGLTLFANRNYGGASRTLMGPVADLRSLGFHDRAESLRLAPGQAWEVCRDIQFQGCYTVTSDWPDLARLGNNLRNQISSARPAFRPGGGWPGPAPWPGQGTGPVVPGAGRIVLYAGMNFSGRSQQLLGTDTRIRMSNVQSVRVFGGNWYLCEDDNFRGRCTTVSGEVMNLRSLGLPRVRSARPAGGPY
ncbi:MAG: hypothetical protein IT182_13640 [Acidobacteria bacterium]|nr:hypothetical protein [Acidobacteriota bacterium]